MLNFIREDSSMYEPGMFGLELLERARNVFKIVCIEGNERPPAFRSNAVLCKRSAFGTGVPRVVVPTMGAEKVVELSLFPHQEKPDNLGTGVYFSSGRRFVLLGRTLSGAFEMPPNVFLSLCSVSDGVFVETAELQVNILGEMELVNCFHGRLPPGIDIGGKEASFISGRDSWVLDREKCKLDMRIPPASYAAARRAGADSGGRVRIDVNPASGIPVVLTSDETCAAETTNSNFLKLSGVSRDNPFFFQRSGFSQKK